MYSKALSLINYNYFPLKKSILITLLAFSLTSCMMIMPGHMSGSMHDSQNNISPDARIDKVCGKTVGPESSFTYEYKGANYYFDSEQCLSVFKNNPEHFLPSNHNDSHQKNSHTAAWIGGAVVMSAMMVAMMIAVF